MTVQEFIDKLHAVDSNKEIEFSAITADSFDFIYMKEICELQETVIIGFTNER